MLKFNFDLLRNNFNIKTQNNDENDENNFIDWFWNNFNSYNYSIYFSEYKLPIS